MNERKNYWLYKFMIIDRAGYRLNVGIILVNNANLVFLGRRNGHDTWQFPQGGVISGETSVDAMYRELHEEIGLEQTDITILGHTKRWLKYRLPQHYIRHDSHPLVIGQKQKWYLLRLLTNDHKIRLDLSNTPEFDSWRWVHYHEPPQQVIFFKRQVYTQAMQELEQLLKKRHSLFRLKRNITIYKGNYTK